MYAAEMAKRENVEKLTEYMQPVSSVREEEPH